MVHSEPKIVIRRILVPLDDSELAATVVPYVASIAKRFQSRCILYHVLESRPRWKRGALPPLIDGLPAENIQQYLDRVAQKLTEQGVEADTLIERGEPASMILKAARAQKADLVAVATHGHGGIGPWLFGTVAHRVVERANSTLLLVRPSPAAPVAGVVQLQRLLIPVDGSEEGEAALPWAGEFARRHEATLHLLQVVPTLESLPGTRATAAALSPAMVGEFLTAASDAAQAYLQRLSAKLRKENVTCEVAVLRGEPADEILQYAGQVGAELTFMATHGRIGFGGAWYGSVVNKVLSRFTSPLILVRAPGKHEEE